MTNAELIAQIRAEAKRQQRNLSILCQYNKELARDCALQNGVHEYYLSLLDTLPIEEKEVVLEKQSL